VIKREIIYKNQDENIDGEWFRYRTKYFPKGFIIAFGFSFNGKGK